VTWAPSGKTRSPPYLEHCHGSAGKEFGPSSTGVSRMRYAGLAMEHGSDLSTPALLFPAISLLFLACTNRFLVLAQLIRQLHGNNHAEVHDIVVRQLKNLRQRIFLMKVMQLLGVIAFILCSLSMVSIFFHSVRTGELLFGASLACLTGSLLVSLYEVWVSTDAIELELHDLEK
jgi:hypothetical protein